MQLIFSNVHSEDKLMHIIFPTCHLRLHTLHRQDTLHYIIQISYIIIYDQIHLRLHTLHRQDTLHYIIQISYIIIYDQIQQDHCM